MQQQPTSCAEQQAGMQADHTSAVQAKATPTAHDRSAAPYLHRAS